MAQNRKPPSFQEYPAAMLSNMHFRCMTLKARGLLFTIRLECWENGQVPSDPVALAKILGQPFVDVQEGLLYMDPFFKTEGGFVRSPELDDYRQHLEDRKKAQSEGGKRGADKTNAKKLGQVTRRGGVGSLVQNSPIQQSPEQPVFKREDSSDDEWLEDYEKGPKPPY